MQPSTFASLGLPPQLEASLAAEGLAAPTSVQAALVPDGLAGRDALASAPTGSGKTLAFGLPLLARLSGGRSRIHRPRGLVVVPTRELAAQVDAALAKPAKAVGVRLAVVTGGTRYDRQVARIRQGADVVVGTPGRLLDLVDQRLLRLDDVEVTVLDEADQLCDLGFGPDVDRLVGQTPAGGQRLLVSATLDDEVDGLVDRHLRDPARHVADEGPVATMSHHVLLLGRPRDRLKVTVSVARANPRCVLFVRSRHGAAVLRDALDEAGVRAADLHGDLPQHVRTRNLTRFRDGEVDAVVATDLASRGLDVPGVGLVLQVDPAGDPKTYLHRSGRTARAGAEGVVLSLATPRQRDRLTGVLDEAGVVVRWHDLRTAPRPLTAESLRRRTRAAPSG